MPRAELAFAAFNTYLLFKCTEKMIVQIAVLLFLLYIAGDLFLTNAMGLDASTSNTSKKNKTETKKTA